MLFFAILPLIYRISKLCSLVLNFIYMESCCIWGHGSHLFCSKSCLKAHHVVGSCSDCFILMYNPSLYPDFFRKIFSMAALWYLVMSSLKEFGYFLETKSSKAVKNINSGIGWFVFESRLYDLAIILNKWLKVFGLYCPRNKENNIIS